MKNLKEKLRPWVRALTNPHLLLCCACAWFITNGWAYCAFGIGTYLGLKWVTRIAMVYLGVLWMPGTPEKLFTFAIAILLMKWWFPDDERTLAAIHRKRETLQRKTREQYEKIKEWCKKHRKQKGEN